jgi:hypothetical protein
MQFKYIKKGHRFRLLRPNGKLETEVSMALDDAYPWHGTYGVNVRPLKENT